MEYCFPELLTREEIIRILKERHLQIPNIDHLSNEELTKLYTTFALPLVRREEKPNKFERKQFSSPNGEEEDKLQRAPKRQSMLDVDVADVNIHEKRMKNNHKPNEINFFAINHLSEGFNCGHSYSKRRKIITGPYS